MEHQYGIVVSNRFLSGFGDVEDPEDLINETQKEKKVKSTKQEKQKKQESPPKKQESETKSRKEDTKDSRSDSRRGGRSRGGNSADNRQPRKNREGGRRQEYTESVENQENQAPNDLRNDHSERPPRSFGGRPPRDRDGDRPPRTFGERYGDRSKDGDFGDRPPRGRGGRGRGGRGRGGRDFRGKREFDRHSGSDKSSSFKPQDKRDGGGTHNWGSFKDDVKEADSNNRVDTFTTEDWDGGENKATPEKKEKNDTEETTPKEEEEEAEKEPEAIEMTLDEYKAMQANVRSKKGFNLRRPGEGEDNAQWKKTYLLKKTATSDQDDEDRDEDHATRERQKPKDHVDINISFYDYPTRGGRGGRRGGPGGGGGRGGRGRGRGGGGRGGGGRGGRSRNDEAHLSLADDAEFPSLGN